MNAQIPLVDETLSSYDDQGRWWITHKNASMELGKVWPKLRSDFPAQLYFCNAQWSSIFLFNVLPFVDFLDLHHLKMSKASHDAPSRGNKVAFVQRKKRKTAPETPIESPQTSAEQITQNTKLFDAIEEWWSPDEDSTPFGIPFANTNSFDLDDVMEKFGDWLQRTQKMKEEGQYQVKILSSLSSSPYCSVSTVIHLSIHISLRHTSSPSLFSLLRSIFLLLPFYLSSCILCLLPYPYLSLTHTPLSTNPGGRVSATCHGAQSLRFLLHYWRSGTDHSCILICT